MNLEWLERSKKKKTLDNESNIEFENILFKQILGEESESG